MSFPKTLNLSFSKMHGLGNDFVMFKGADVPKAVWDTPGALEKLAAIVCDRHFGIGGDGLILEAPPSDPSKFDIRFVYLNGDGSWAEMCGNGIRCFARFVSDNGLITKNKFTAETLAGPISPQLNADQTVTVDMGPPVYEGEKTLTVLDRQIPIMKVSMGNPHCLIFQDDLDKPLDPAVFGPVLETHPEFPAKTNVEFLTLKPNNTLDCVVWERGCGFTLACGTGACASAVAAIRLGKLSGTSAVNVILPGGPLSIEWAGEGQSVMMTGPATYAYTGQIEVEFATLMEPVSAK